MPENLSIRMDPLNPGHFFACCGLMELLNIGNPGLEAHFSVENRRPREGRFNLPASPSSLPPLIAALRSSNLSFVPHENETVRPASLQAADFGELLLDWWLDEFQERAISLKCWAGQVTTRNLFEELIPLLDPKTAGESLFYAPQLTKAKFGVDPRSAWNALDLGFSPNEHGRDAATFVAVEILAAIGLQSFRPDYSSRKGVPYSLWLVPLPAPVARVAFAQPWDGLKAVKYAFRIEKRGQSYKYFTFAQLNTQDRRKP